MNPATAPAAPAYAPPPRLLALLGGVVVAAAATFCAGLVFAPERTWVGFLVAFHLFTGLALAGPLFLALLYVSGGRFATSMHEVARGMGRALPAAGALGLLLLAGVHALFEWSHPAAVAADPLLSAKAAYLNPTFFALRLVAIFAAWLLLGRLVLATRDDAPRAVRIRRGALFVAAFGVTYSVASVDWLMSLEPHWFSTIFAVHTAAGLVLSGLAAGTILVVALRRSGSLRDAVTDDQLHDLGKLIFGFSLFWAYVWYCQYMLIWYTNLPEETSFYLRRREGVWGALGTLNLVLNFGVPFLALLSRRARRSEKALVRVSVVLLAGRVVDLFVLAGPPLLGADPAPSVWIAAPVAGAAALFPLVVLRALRRRGTLVPHADPGLPYALHYHA